jgi:hypothetical protein
MRWLQCGQGVPAFFPSNQLEDELQIKVDVGSQELLEDHASTRIMETAPLGRGFVRAGNETRQEAHSTVQQTWAIILRSH